MTGGVCNKGLFCAHPVADVFMEGGVGQYVYMSLYLAVKLTLFRVTKIAAPSLCLPAKSH